MNYRIVLLVCLVIAGCAAPQPAPTATAVLTATPLPITSTPTVTFTPTSVPLPTGKKIVFQESGGKALAGTAYGNGKTAIILANMSIGNETQWSPFVAAVDKQNFTTFTFNYRTTSGALEETGLVLQKLRESGYKRIICIGASLGVKSCGSIAYEPELVGIVLIAGPLQNKLDQVTYPKLFIAGALDTAAFNTQMNYDQAAEPKKLVLFEGNDTHGTNLFSSKDRQPFLALLLDFVNGLASR